MRMMLYLYEDEKESGPYSEKELYSLYRNGQLRANSLVRAKGETDCCRVSELPLFPSFRAKARFCDLFSLYILAAFPILSSVFVSPLAPSPLSFYVLLSATLLCLTLDFLLHQGLPDFSLYSFLLGLILLPYYLWFRRDSDGKHMLGPLCLWLLLFILRLAYYETITH